MKSKLFWIRQTASGFESGLCEHGEQPAQGLCLLFRIQNKGDLNHAIAIHQRWVRENLGLYALPGNFIEEDDIPF